MPKQDISQSGRSMVETLVVLAIMGVLSIGGIAGFNWGMNRYRATRVVSELKRDSVILKQRAIRQIGKANDSYAAQIDSELDTMTFRYAISVSETEQAAFEACEAGRFVKVNKISQDVCDHLGKLDSLSEVQRYTGCPVLINETPVSGDFECLETNALVIGVRPDKQGGRSADPTPVNRNCPVKGDEVITDGAELDCGKCDNGVMKWKTVALSECETCGPATGYVIQDDPDCSSCTPSDVCHECIDGADVLIDPGKTKVKTGSPDVCVECLTNADCTDTSKPVCNADGVCEACTTETVTHSDLNANGCCVTSTESYCPVTETAPTARTCTQTCTGTCETDGTCTPPVPTCTGDLVLNSDETACVCPTGKVLKTGTTDVCVECNTNTDCKDSYSTLCKGTSCTRVEKVCNASNICRTDCSSYPGTDETYTGDLLLMSGIMTTCRCPGDTPHWSKDNRCISCNGRCWDDELKTCRSHDAQTLVGQCKPDTSGYVYHFPLQHRYYTYTATNQGSYNIRTNGICKSNLAAGESVSCGEIDLRFADSYGKYDYSMGCSTTAGTSSLAVSVVEVCSP